MSYERPPYRKGDVDRHARDHVLDQILHPPTEHARAHWERILSKTMPRPWWRRVLGLPKRKVVLPAPPAIDSTSSVVPALEGFFAARPDELDDRVVDDGPYGRFPTVEVKMMDPVKVSTLGAIVGAGTYAELIEPALEPARTPVSRDGECGLFQVPTSIRDGLADMCDAERVAAEWCATPELRLDDFKRSDAAALLGRLRPLAARARSEDRELWVWWSL